MKKTAKTLLSILFIAIFMFSLFACAKKQDTSRQVHDELWENAIYLTDTEFGKGSKELIVEVTAGDQSVTFTVHTDETTVGAALIEHDLISGEEGAYGLYVKNVNGITADYDVDQSYWAFYVDGEYATTGVDTTEITEGSVYRLEYTK